MKRFWENLVEWKTTASLLFTGSVILFFVIRLIMGETVVEISALASLLIISAIGAFLQFMAFTDRIIKKMRYTLRMIVFVIPFLALLAGNAYFFHWFPFGTSYWISFVVVFIVVFIGMTAGFEIYYHIMGKK